ncbi:unnamed protein product [Soboliphyme baturini]|uniref:Isochorismatase domain-containing protein n=1 Tax=Soboliphyme baturini TaxID=241478 RepID=A0A183ISR7_9BILA|nr:unnamed protein product [Soboliphyme baturini]
MTSSDHHVALLVIDMQEEFRTAVSSIISNVNKTIDHCRTRKIPVIFSQHGHRYPEVDGGQLKELWGMDGLIKYGSKRWQLLEELHFIEGDYLILEKRRYDTFYGTILDNLLKMFQVTSENAEKSYDNSGSCSLFTKTYCPM